jgi:hypothetical protein
MTAEYSWFYQFSIPGRKKRGEKNIYTDVSQKFYQNFIGTWGTNTFGRLNTKISRGL